MTISIIHPTIFIPIVYPCKVMGNGNYPNTKHYPNKPENKIVPLFQIVNKLWLFYFTHLK